MTNQLMRILDPEISGQERDIICEASFGKSFNEMIYRFRADDLKEGVECGDYLLLSAENFCSPAKTPAEDEHIPETVVCFMLARPYDSRFLLSLGMLYGIDDPGEYGFMNPPRFYTKLYGIDAVQWAMSKIQEAQAPF